MESLSHLTHVIAETHEFLFMLHRLIKFIVNAHVFIYCEIRVQLINRENYPTIEKNENSSLNQALNNQEITRETVQVVEQHSVE